MYQWRSDPNFNSNLPKVTFKSAAFQQQEEMFANFLHKQ